ERSGARNDHATVLDRQSALDHRLQTACPHHTWQRPAGEWEEAFARSGGENKPLIAEFTRAGRCFCEQSAWSRLCDDLRARQKLDLGRTNALQPRAGLRAMRLCPFAAPDLAADIGIVIDNADLASPFGCAARGGESSGTGADRQDVEAAFSHRSESP